MWSLSTQSAAVAIIISCASSAALLLRARSYLYVRYAAFALSIALYFIFVFLKGISIRSHVSLDCLQLMSGGLVIIFATTFLDALVGDAGLVAEGRRRKTLLAGVCMIVVGATPLATSSLVKLACAILAIALLGIRAQAVARKAALAESIADQTRLRYFSYAGIFALLAFSCDLASSYGLDVPPIGGLAIAIYLYFIYQALLVSRLLDLHELLGKAVVFGSLALILAAVYGMLVIWVETRKSLFVLNTLLASGLILILYEPLKAFLEDKTARLFFIEHITFAEDIRQMTRSLATVIEVPKACEMLLNFIYDKKRATHASIFLLDKARTGFHLQAFRGPKNLSVLEGKAHPVLFRHLSDNAHAILRSDLSKNNPQQKNPAILSFLEQDIALSGEAERKALLQSLDALQAELLIPLYNNHTTFGFVCLKDERLSDAYTKDEIKALSALANQLAITAENSQLFAELKEHDRLAALGEMSAGLAHEIRNPLAAIKGAAQVLEPEHLPKEDKELVRIIIEEVNRLNGVVTEFLDYARPSQAKHNPLQLNDTIARTLQLMEHALADNITLSVQAAKALPHMMGDAEQIRQMLINLIINAKDALQEKGGYIRISTRVVEHKSISRQLGATKRSIELLFEDNGEGFSEKLRDKIFIPFFTTKASGTGLGLALCQRVVQDHKGSIEVRSSPGKGTAFIIRFPIHEKSHDT